jgi:hypothetical protein
VASLVGLVLTVDQRGSRRGPDRVGDLLAAVADAPTRLAFQRTAGDEVQALVTEPAHLPGLVERVLRSGDWRLGLGLGAVQAPLPEDVREARGPAFVRARAAVEAARTSPAGLRVHAPEPAEASAHALESALWLWASLLERRTRRGWEVVDLVDAGATYEQAAHRLGVTPSAVSQRAAAAGLAEGRRARELVAHLADLALAAARSETDPAAETHATDRGAQP